MGVMGGGERSQASIMAANLESKEHPVDQPPSVNFPEGQSALASASKEPLVTNGVSYTIERAYLADKDWTMDRGREGRITGRRAAVLAYYKGGPNAYCYKRRGFLNQEEQGGAWGRPKVQWESLYFRVNCQQVDGLPASQP
jgi:hypothetical protein